MVGYKVRILSVTGNMFGIVVNEYRNPYREYHDLYWVRLTNGILMKDVTEDEFELAGICVGDFVEVTRYEPVYTTEHIRFKGVVKSVLNKTPEDRNSVYCILDDGTEVFRCDTIKYLTINS